MKYVIFLMIVFSISCVSTSTSVLTSDSYDEKKNITTWMVLPYGQVDIPGKWTKSTYLHQSRQQFFKKDSVSLGIALTLCEKYPFYDPNQNDFQFLLAFYQWESDYYTNDRKLVTTILEKDSINNFIVWEVVDNDLINLFLFGRKGKISYNILLAPSRSDSQDVELLKTIYMKK